MNNERGWKITTEQESDGAKFTITKGNFTATASGYVGLETAQATARRLIQLIEETDFLG